MDWLGSLFGGIGNALNSLFGGGNNSDEERKRRQQQQQQAQQQSQAPQQVQPGFQSALPSLTQPQQRAPELNLVQAQDLQRPQEKKQQQPAPATLQRPQQAPVPAPQPVMPGFHNAVPTVAQITGLERPQQVQERPQGNPIVDFGKSLISGVQQAAGNVADIALMGGNVIGNVATDINPFISEERKNQIRAQDYANTEMLRNKVKGAKTVTGDSFNPNPDFQWTGDPVRDAATLAGRGLQTGLDATMFVNPAQLVRGGEVRLLPTAARDAAFFGGGQGTATAARTYGQGGTPEEAIAAGAQDALLSGVTQGALELGAGFVGNRLHRAPEGPGLESANPNFEADAVRQITEQAVADQANAVQAQQLQRPSSANVSADVPLQRAEVVAPAGPQPQAPIPEFTAAQAPDVVPSVQKLTKPTSKAVKKTAQADLPEVQVGDSAKTGTTGKSTGKYSKGQQYEKTSVEASRLRGEREAANTSYNKFVQKIDKNKSMNGADRDTAVALQKRFKPGTPEHRKLGDMVNKYHTESAQTLSTIERTVRKTADAKQITDRFANKLYSSIDDNQTLSDKSFESVVKRNEDFTAARDAQNAAIEQFNNSPSEANVKDVVDAFNKADAADRAARFEEYKVAAEAAKGSKNPKAKKLVRDLEKDAGVYTMDWVDSSLLSSTRVMLNNFINTLTSRGEEQLFGKAGAALARKLTKADIGGGSIEGGRFGAKLGSKNLIADTKLRQNAKGNALVRSIKNYTTTGNTLGERNTFAAAYSGIFDYYRQQLKKAGYSGDELGRRSLVNSLADPDGIKETYMNHALAANAMSSMTNGHNATKFESWLTDSISRKLGDSAAAKTGAKSMTRILVGFPTVIVRSAQQGAKRSLLGTFSAAQAVVNAAKGGDKALTAQLIKNSVKEAGSGATMMALGAALGNAGLITGAYPSDKNERELWKREGRTENSIKIGDNWYSLPAALGVFALPFMLGANAGQNMRDGKPPTDNVAQSTISTLVNTLPTDNLGNAISFLDDLQAGRDTSKYLSQTGASFVKSVTPLSSLVGQIAKMFDPTANDTTQGDALAQMVAKVQNGIPGAANALPDKKVNGNTIENPSPIAILFGAISKEQGAGVKKTNQIAQQLKGTQKTLSDYGVFTNDVRGILDDETKAVFDKAKSGDTVSEDEMKSLIKGVTKGVSETEDTRFLEDGKYDANLAVLKAKRDMLAADPTTQRSTLKNYDKQITRGEIYKDRQTPYELIDQYKSINLTEWRNMGDTESDSYNKKLYDALWALDEAMTKKGVSRNSSDESKQKYYAKEKKTGRGRGGGRSLTNAAGGTLGSPVSLGKVDFGNLRQQKISGELPTIQKLKGSDLVKKRTISVGRKL